MKKCASITFVSLEKVTLLLTVLLFPLCATVVAQSPQSAQYKFPSLMGDNVIIRETVAGVPVMSYRSYLETGFLYIDINTNNVMKCSIDDTMTVNEGLISYKINDMRVIGYMCYFCGVRKYSHNDPETGLHVTDSIGFLGRFHLDSLGFGQTVQYHLKLVRETKSLDRMATYAAGNDTVIAMIGIVDEPASQSCVAVARFDYPGVVEIYC